jgi:hypothetical protein
LTIGAIFRNEAPYPPEWIASDQISATPGLPPRADFQVTVRPRVP